MYFSNPAVIRNFNDVKLAMIETDAEEVSYLDLVSMIRHRLERLAKEEVDEMVKQGSTRKEAVMSIMARAGELLQFVDNVSAPEDEHSLVKILMTECLNFSSWQSELWSNFEEIHVGKITKTTKIPTQGVLNMPNDVVMDAINELTLQGIFELLMKYN